MTTLNAHCQVSKSTLEPTIKNNQFCFTRSQTEFIVYVMEEQPGKDSLIFSQREQILFLETRLGTKSSIQKHQNTKIQILEKQNALKDSIIVNNKKIEEIDKTEIKEARKEVKKWKRLTFGAVALVILSLFVN